MGNLLTFHNEGDSKSVNSSWSVGYWDTVRTQNYVGNNLASGSSAIVRRISYAANSAVISGTPGSNSVVGREQQVAANFQAGALNLLSIFIGANNFQTSVTATNDAAMAALAAYCDRQRQRGFYVVVCTMTPQASPAANPATFNTNRATYNPQYKALVGVSAHAFIDFGGDSLIGPDAAAADTSLYSDGLHETSLGKGHLARIAAPVFDTFVLAATGAIPLDKGAFGYDTRRFRIVF